MKHSFWVRGTYIFQLATAIIHSMSFFAEQKGANETEAQMLQLMTQYKMDMGQGFHRSMADIVTSLSACLTLLCLMAGLMLLVLYRSDISKLVLKRILLINSLVFAAGLVMMAVFAFLPPVVCFGLITFCSIMAWATIPGATANAAT
jgi:hypothetical protein